MIVSSYSGDLSPTSSMYNRSGGVTGNNYFQALQVTISSSGAHHFTSVSLINTYAYLYNSSFNPSRPSQNLIISNGGVSQQFLLTVHLSCGINYVLIVTTHDREVFGNFSVRVVGTSLVDLTALKPTIVTSLRTTTSCGLVSHCPSEKGLGTSAIAGIVAGAMVLVCVFEGAGNGQHHLIGKRQVPCGATPV